MALEIRRPKAEPMGGLVADRRLYLSADRTQVLEEGDPRAAWVFATPDAVIPGEDVARLGLRLVHGKVIQAPPEEADSEGPDSVPPKDTAKETRKTGKGR